MPPLEEPDVVIIGAGVIGCSIVAIGSSGNQFKSAGVAGQMMADLIDAVEGGHDHDTDPVWSAGRFTGRPLDIGAFSRNRSINTDSSMSVQG